MFSIYDWTQLRNLATDWISWFKRYISLSLGFEFYFHKDKQDCCQQKQHNKAEKGKGRSLSITQASINQIHASPAKTYITYNPPTTHLYTTLPRTVRPLVTLTLLLVYPPPCRLVAPQTADCLVVPMTVRRLKYLPTVQTITLNCYHNIKNPSREAQTTRPALSA
jgi:hypothetical protein